jgi:predicted Rossmann fold flavoprotein
VQSIHKEGNGRFTVSLSGLPQVQADVVMIATGSSQIGYRLAKSLGHTITELAPSLFSFKISDTLISDLPGLTFSNAETKLTLPKGKIFKENGPLLVTHWGLSGPAVLKISAWAAREMMHADYKAKLTVNWLGCTLAETTELVQKLKEVNQKSQIGNIHPPELAKRFWLNFLRKLNINFEKRWSDISKKELNLIASQLFATDFVVEGKNRYKDEFVECGGIDLKEIHFKTMESKICPGLYFAGEVLDIDGITGGFNFQNAWTGSWIAAQAMVLNLPQASK